MVTRKRALPQAVPRKPPRPKARQTHHYIARAILDPIAKTAPPALTAHLEQAATTNKALDFAIAWAPPNNSPVYIGKVTVGAIAVHPPQPSGDMKPNSAFRTTLGVYAQGTALQIGWSVQAFNDLNGIAIYVSADGGAWTRLAQKVPLANQATWSAQAAYTVP
jgi:hypothetical protein